MTAALAVAAAGLWASALTKPLHAFPNSSDLALRAAPILGDERAPVRLVYFYRSDCSYCTETDPFVRRLVRENGDVVHARFVRLDAGDNGLVASACAERTGHAGGTALASCLAVRADIEADLALAAKHGVDAVPEVWIGRHRVVGAIPFDSLNRLLTSVVADL